MKPTKCLACGGSSFSSDQYITRLVVSPRPIAKFFQNIAARSSICLTCGLVATRVDDDALQRLREQNPSA